MSLQDHVWGDSALSFLISNSIIDTTKTTKLGKSANMYKCIKEEFKMANNLVNLKIIKP
jgi:hypothetical protein